MLLPAPPLYPRKRKPRPKPKRPVTALTLVAAAFNDFDLYVTLTFDRAIEINAMDPATILIDDDATGQLYQGAGTPTLVTANAVDVSVSSIPGTFHPGIHLTAEPSNGIAAVDDGAQWSGVTDVELPFP